MSRRRKAKPPDSKPPGRKTGPFPSRPEIEADEPVVLPPINKVDFAEASPNTKADPLAFASLILGIFGLFFFALQENGVQVGWVLSLLIYCTSLAATLWAVQRVPFRSNLIRLKPVAYLGCFLLFGPAGFIGTRNQFRHDHPVTTKGTKPDDQKELLALARLTKQGWKRQVENGTEFFELSNQPLPDMREATAAFVALGRPIALRLQTIPDLSGLNLLGMANVCDDIWIGASNLTSVDDLRTFTHLKKLGISQVPFDNGGYVDLSPLGDLKELKTLNLNADRPISTDFLSHLTGLDRLDLTATPLRTTRSLQGLTSLRYLSLLNTFSSDLTIVEQFPKLEELHVGETELPSLMSLTKPLALHTLYLMSEYAIDTNKLPIDDHLEALYLYGSPMDLGGLSKVPHLKTLYMQFTSLAQYGHLDNVDAISTLKELNQLTITQYDLRNIAFLKSCRELRSVTLYTDQFHSIDELSTLPNLSELRLANLPINSVASLLNSKSLNTLSLAAIKGIPAEQLDALRDRGVRIVR